MIIGNGKSSLFAPIASQGESLTPADVAATAALAAAAAPAASAADRAATLPAPHHDRPLGRGSRLLLCPHSCRVLGAVAVPPVLYQNQNQVQIPKYSSLD